MFLTDPQANGEYREVHISHQWTDKRTRRITVSRVHDGYTPKYEKHFCLAVLHDPSDAEAPVQDIKINGKSVNKAESKEAFVDVIYNERKK